MVVVPRFPREHQEDKPQGTATFHVSPGVTFSGVTFSNVTLPKARHMAKPRFEDLGRRVHISSWDKLQNHFAKDGHVGSKELGYLKTNCNFFFLNKISPNIQKEAEKPLFNNLMTFKPPLVGHLTQNC